MKRFRSYPRKLKRTKNTSNKLRQVLIVLFLVLINAIIMFNVYGKRISEKAEILVSEEIDEVVYEFFNELITNDVINKKNINDILEITRNSEGEILTVNYDLEKTYTILTLVSKILKQGLLDFQKGKVNVHYDNRYLKTSPYGMIMEVPLFISSKNIFLNNLGPRIPVLISFNETLLTNVKTKVTNYGLNNALLEIYITVEMQKLIITPIKKSQDKFHYDILVASLVVNGRVPDVYGGIYENGSAILN